MRLSAARVREVLQYDAATGAFVWTVHAGHRFAGKVAGTLRSDGRRQIAVDGHHYLASRLAWLFVMGEWPSALVDHENRNRADDRWDNLRLADYSQNNANRGVTGKIKGVQRLPSGRYGVRVKRLGKTHCVGTFDTLEEAGAAYIAAATQLHGEFACNGGVR